MPPRLRRDEADALEMLAQDVFGSFFHDADDLVVEAGAQAVGHGGDGLQAMAVHLTPLSPRNWSMWLLNSKIWSEVLLP